MVFLDFFEALLGCAEVYVVEASEQPDMMTPVDDEQDPHPNAPTTAAPSLAQSVPPEEPQVHTLLIHMGSGRLGHSGG